MKRLAALLLAGIFAAGPASAQDKIEKPKLSIATASLGLTYLPLILADRLGYFKDEGLTVEIAAFSGGSKALEALLGGSTDVVSGAYSNTLTMAAKGQKLIAFVAQVEFGRPQVWRDAPQRGSIREQPVRHRPGLGSERMRSRAQRGRSWSVWWLIAKVRRCV